MKIINPDYLSVAVEGPAEQMRLRPWGDGDYTLSVDKATLLMSGNLTNLEAFFTDALALMVAERKRLEAEAQAADAA